MHNLSKIELLSVGFMVFSIFFGSRKKFVK